MLWEGAEHNPTSASSGKVLCLNWEAKPFPLEAPFEGQNREEGSGYARPPKRTIPREERGPLSLVA